ncbi:MAG TPA: hypothetical protein VMS76_18930 [Planctomycetota bacterium]|nr:hypothetical protein [Planctomycetota bacterium]
MSAFPRQGPAARLEFAAPRRVRRAAAAAALLGWTALLFGWSLDPERAFFAYLGAFVYGITLALGALALVMMAHAAGAKWFVVVRRLAESVAATLPLFVLLFVPLLFGLEQLYPWVPPLDGLEGHARHAVEEKQAYLNVPFFVARGFGYLLVWSVLAAALWAWSVRQDETPESAPLARAVAWSGPGLLVFAFTATLAAIDWVMSLDPGWYSTVFGVYFMVGGMVGALGLLLVAARGLERAGPLAGALAAPHYHALGRLLLVFVALWAYVAYAQGFLIWIAGLPHEIGWYLTRLDGGWGLVALTLVAGHFALPFALLLSRSFKRSGRRLAVLGVWMLAVHYLDVFWLILPALARPEARAHWLDAPALAAVLGTATLVGLWRLTGHAVLPLHDPRLPQALGYESE